MSETPTSQYREAKASTAQGAFGQAVEIGPHRFAADEPPVNGGNDAGPAPHEWVLAGLASCVAMTVQGYAKRKGLPVRHVEVRVRGHREAACSSSNATSRSTATSTTLSARGCSRSPGSAR
jgi:putative redox protein